MFIVDSPSPLFIWSPLVGWERIDTLTLAQHLDPYEFTAATAYELSNALAKFSPRCSTFTRNDLITLLNLR
jgi:hypothetical protein